MTTHEEIFGEERVDATTAAPLADRAFAEADRLWASTATGWRMLSDAPVRNETIPLRGVFADTRVDLERGRATIAAPAQLVFDLLVSRDGTRLIDPYTDPKDRDLLLESFDVAAWRGPDAHARGSKLEVIRNLASVPFMAKREIIVLNMVDVEARYYACKSVLHAAAPGASAWGPRDAQAQQPRSTVRALNTFAVRVTPATDGDDDKCVIELLNHVNLAGNFSPLIQRQFNKTFLPSVVDRLQKAVALKLKTQAAA